MPGEHIQPRPPNILSASTSASALHEWFRWTKHGANAQPFTVDHVLKKFLDGRIVVQENYSSLHRASIPPEPVNHTPHTAQVYHINLLPPEILCEIFVHCVPHKNLQTSPHEEDSPIPLTHVCAYWRDVATSLAILWSSIVIGTCRYDTTWLDWLPAWLKRSQDQPLRLEFISFEIVPLLVPHIHRWKAISAFLDVNNVERFLALPVARAPSLTSLHIRTGNCDRQILERLITFTHSIPSLCELGWYSKDVPDALLRLSFHHLTRVSLTCPIPVDQFLHFLSSSRQVIHLVARDLLPPLTTTAAIISLPHLISLDVWSRKNMRDLLDSLTLPLLRKLRLWASTRMGDTSRIHEALGNLVARSSCQLETFELDDGHINEDDVIGYLTLPCLRSIKELDIHVLRFSDRALALLVYPQLNAGGEDILPYLRNLKLKYCTTGDGAFADMVASRWASSRRRDDGILPTPLVFVNVVFYHAQRRHSGKPKHGHELDVSKIEAFMSEGLDIRWAEF